MVNETAEAALLGGGVDPILARHIAHLFVRDSISLFSEKVDQDDATELDHFEVRSEKILALAYRGRSGVVRPGDSPNRGLRAG